MFQTTSGDPVVVNAEKTTALATDSFDSFLKFEYDNRAALQKASPQIKAYADVIRKNGQMWLQSARIMTRAYKNNRSADNKANLQTALAVITNAITQIQQYTSSATVKLTAMKGKQQ
jgi:hypothetical protein